MKRLTLTLLLLPLLAGETLAAEDWIGFEEVPPLQAGFDLAVEDGGDLSGGFNLRLALGDSAGIYGDYHVSELSDEEEEFERLALVTALWFQLSELVDLEVSYFFEGNMDELEKETLGLALGFNRGNWNFQLQLEDGELHLFTRGELGDIVSEVIPEQIDSDLDGFGLRLGWQQRSWYWQASHQRFDYERDLSPLDTNAFVQFIVKSGVLAQSSLLISKYTTFVVGHADFENDYSLLLVQEQSAIDDIYSDSLMVSWRHWTSPNLGYLIAASFSESEDAGLTLGLQWVM
jgi:hypothetical protein